MTDSNQNPSRGLLFFKKKVTPHLEDWLLLIFVSILVTATMSLYIDFLPSDVQVGNIAASDVKADQNYELVDRESTEKLKEEAALNVTPVYDFDTELVGKRIEEIRKSFTDARQSLLEIKNLDNGVIDEGKLRQDFQLSLGVALTDSDYGLIRQTGFSEDLEQSLVTMLEPVQRQAIIEDKSELLSRGEKGIVFRTLDPTKTETIESDLSEYESILSRKDAESAYHNISHNDVQKRLNLDFMESASIKTAQTLFPRFIKVNVSQNKAETDIRRERARGNIQNIIYKLQKGQIIIRRGDRYETWHLTVIEGIRKARQKVNSFVGFAGSFFLTGLVISIVYVFARKHIRKFRPTRRDKFFLALMMVTFIGVLRLGSFMSTSLRENMPFMVDITTLYYLIPVVAGTMIVRYILNAETSFLFCVILSSFAGVFLDNNLGVALYYLVGGVYGAHLVGHAEKRSTVLRCGLSLGLMNVLLVICLGLMDKHALTTTVDVESLLVSTPFAFLGGLLNSLVMLAISPVIESIFNYTTNIQLLELANMNHPLLREMIVRAPGTYHHSQLVGILAEAGARAISANPLLARVGSYYHDIGKMRKPLYFIENQKGDNPHDRLAPTMSALIIEAHVKDGLEMAKEYTLPQAIVDFIPEHQGTKLIGYFYNKAKKAADADASKIDEKDFRYKGPLPQSRESGIVMLSDTVEAAVRSMPEKSPQKIQATVEKLVNMHFVDGQLNQCDLTLRDLHQLVDAFTKILIGIYHQRVEYPDQKIGKSQLKVSAPELDAGGYNPYEKPRGYADNNVAPLFRDKK